ncbi:MAG: acetyl-CoA acetyltransferase [Deltaproteobacteria bacterium]|nr:acetyl-CoA acetyltransferase [Deltaproteobacteria bacterium]
MNEGRDRDPVLVGAAQWSERRDDPAAAAGPVEILAAVARRAADDAGAGKALLEALDTVAVPSVTAWRMRDAAGLLVEALGIAPARRVATPIGGNTPTMLVNRFAREIAGGRCEAVLVAGCDVFFSVLQARRRGVRLAWPTGGDGRSEAAGDDASPVLEVEQRHGMVAPSSVYPLFENAWRARRGWSLDEHRRRLGALLAPMTEVAAANPHAWFPVRRSAGEIATPATANRMVAFPYTKYMNAVLEVDQGAALILCSRARARALGVPEERLVHWWGGGDAKEEPWPVALRPDLSRSPGVARVGAAALAEAGLTIGEVEHLDLYSCFPSAVQLARDALGIADDDPRPVTLTGGLPYAGGPGNAYTLHALARAAGRLRAAPGTHALVTGVGWYLSKHSAVVLGAAPRPDAAPAIGSIAVAPSTSLPVELAEEAAEGSVETYTVLFDREGAPVRGIVLARLADGRRAVANTPPDRTLLEALAARDPIGTPGRLRPGQPLQLFEPD